MGGVLTLVLRPREAHCPVVRSVARELLTCLVMQPVMNFASPGYVLGCFIFLVCFIILLASLLAKRVFSSAGGTLYKTIDFAG